MGLINSLFSRNSENYKIEILADVQHKEEVRDDNEILQKDKKKFSRKEISCLVDGVICNFKSMYLSPNGFVKKKKIYTNEDLK